MLRRLRAVVFPMLFCLLPLSVMAQIPRTIAYQGVITDANDVAKQDASYQFTFRLYETRSGGSELWAESKTLAVTKGLFSTLLGDAIAFPLPMAFDRPYFLGIEVGAEGEMTPRIPLAAVAYSMNTAIGVPVGTIVSFAGPQENVPTGWLICDGSLVNASAFPALYQAIGTNWDDASSSFKLPDLRGRFLRGVDATGTLDKGGARSVGSYQGYATAKPLQGFSAGGGEHSHSYVHNDATGYGENSRDKNHADGNGRWASVSGSGAHWHSISGGDPETRPVNAAVHYIIKAF